MTSRLQCAKLGRGFCIGRRRIEIGDAEAVGHEGPGASGRCEDGDAVAAELAAGGQGERNVEQPAECLRADYANLLEQRVVHSIRACQRAGV